MLFHPGLLTAPFSSVLNNYKYNIYVKISAFYSVVYPTTKRSERRFYTISLLTYIHAGLEYHVLKNNCCNMVMEAELNCRATTVNDIIVLSTTRSTIRVLDERLVPFFLNASARHSARECSRSRCVQQCECSSGDRFLSF